VPVSGIEFKMMLWLALISINIQGRNVEGYVSEEVSPVEPMGEKEDGNYRIAPFFGWTAEKQQIVDNYDPQKAKAHLREILRTWNSTLRRVLNDYYASTGDRDAVCVRKSYLGDNCPVEHPLNEKMKSLTASLTSGLDPWLYAEIVSTYEDMERLVEAITDTKKRPKDIKRVLSGYHIAVPNVRVAKKPFSWDGGYTLLDGTNWTTSFVAASTSREYNPTVVAVGGADTLVFAFNVDNCNAWCPGTTTNECVVVGHSYDRGQTMNLDLCLYNTSANLGEVAIGADPYRKTFTVAWTDDYWYPDYDIYAWTFHINNPNINNNGPITVDYSTVSTVTPYVNSEFNWGKPGCQGQWTSSCSCSALDNWIFIGYNKLGGSDNDGDGYRDAIGVRIARSTDCGASYSVVYDGPSRNGSAYDHNQIMLETTNDPRGSSSVCSSSNGGDNTIQAVYTWKSPSSCTDPCSNNYITHLFTDASGSWGGTWAATDVLSGYWKPISQPWMSVARALTSSSMTHLILFESRYSSTDADIRGIHASGMPPGGWSSVFNVDYTTIDSRTPTVHTDARWQWCPGATTSTASYFHTAFYHKCPNTYDGRLCSEPYTSYNNTYRVAVMRAQWSSPESWGPEYCKVNLTYADTIAIPPPPSYSNGGLWQSWWQINGTTFRAHNTYGSAWWFGALWVYLWSSSDWDLEWTILSCLVGNGDDDLSVGEAVSRGDGARVSATDGGILLEGEGRVAVYSPDGRLIRSLTVKGRSKVPLSPGAYFVRTGRSVRKVVVR